MNSNFWDHLLNAAGHLLDASSQSQAEAEEAATERKAKRAGSSKRTGPMPTVKVRGFDEKEPCCTATRAGAPSKSGR